MWLAVRKWQFLAGFLLVVCTVMHAPQSVAQNGDLVDSSRTTLFLSERLNYKPTKFLHYDILLNTVDCSLQPTNFDLHYVETTTGERLEITGNSRAAVEPENILIENPHVMKFNFKGLVELFGAGANLEVFSYRDIAGHCAAITLADFQGKRYALSRVRSRLRLLGSHVVGVQSGSIVGQLAQSNSQVFPPFKVDENSNEICVFGSCD